MKGRISRPYSRCLQSQRSRSATPQVKETFSEMLFANRLFQSLGFVPPNQAPTIRQKDV